MKDSTFLLYDKPACAWTQALPIGNGTLGGMIYGKVKEETVSLNHDELWTGHPKDTVPDGALELLKSPRPCARREAARIAGCYRIGLHEHLESGVSALGRPYSDLRRL